MRKRPLNQPFLLTLLFLPLLGLSGCGGDDAPESQDPVTEDDDDHDDEFSLGRLSVSDAENSSVYVVDLDSHDVTTIAVEAPSAYLSSDSAGSHAFLAHYEDARFEVIDTGISVSPHGDHSHVKRDRPSKHDFSLDGLEPTHVVTGNDHIAVYFDGDGRLALFPHDALDETAPITPEYVDANRPHHGVGVPFGEVLLLTHAEAATSEDEEQGWLGGVPVGVTVRAWNEPNEVAQTISGCSHLHGEAVVGDAAAFACDEGILLLSDADAGQVEDELIPYPDDAESRALGLVHGAGHIAIGDSGAGLLRIDASAGEVTAHDLPDGADRKAQAMSRDGDEVYVLDTSGQLHRLAAADLSPSDAPLEVVDATSVEDRVLVVAGADRVYVIDGRDGKIHSVDTTTWSLEEDPLVLPGKPFSAAITGMASGSH